MKGSVLEEIRLLRGSALPDFNRKNTNRYRVLIREADGSDTAYYFSAPIYRAQNGSLVELRFRESGGNFRFTGSNATVTVSADDLLLDGPEGALRAFLACGRTVVTGRAVKSARAEIFPALNGAAVKWRCSGGVPLRMRLEAARSFLTVRANTKCFAWMGEPHKPFCVISAIGSLDAYGRFLGPAVMTYRRHDERNNTVEMIPCSAAAEWIFFEITLYERKLIHDTTVENKNPLENNAFGGTAFLGTSETFGEQWLYLRPDASCLALRGGALRRAVLHLPKFDAGTGAIKAFGLSRRFCSFGSAWENKIDFTAPVAESVSGTQYYHLDLSNLLIDPRTAFLRETEGVVLQTKEKGTGFTVISAGDNSYRPQILEINFRK